MVERGHEVNTGINPELEKKAKIKVAICSTPWLEVPPKSYGGIEALEYDFLIDFPNQNIEYFLHTVGETAKAQTAEKLSEDITYHWESGLYDRIREPGATTKEAIHTISFYKEVEKRLKNGEDIALIHHHLMFTGGVFAFGKRLDIPHLVTIHGPVEDPYDMEFLESFKDEKGIYFNFISFNQGRNLHDLPHVRVVHNGVNTEMFPLQEEKKDFLLNIGRIHPDKGQKEAIEVAQRTGKSLVLAGNIDDQNYFEQEINPKLDVRLDKIGSREKPLEFTKGLLEKAGDPEIIYIGEADFEDKLWLYQNAKVFLNHINWEEPFGLVMTESLSCGTPVVATRRGAAPEIVAHRRTGFIVNDVDEMTNAVKMILENRTAVTARACRDHVIKNFSKEVMASGYREAYDEVLERERKSLSKES